MATMYETIRDWLYSSIAAGTYQVGDQLPTLDALNERFGTRGPRTATRAYAELADLGIVERRHGVGFFLRSTTPIENAAGTAAAIARLDAIEEALQSALADLRSLRASLTTTAPRLGEWWKIRSTTDHQLYSAVLITDDGTGEPIWYVAMDNAGYRRDPAHFEPIRKLNTPDWTPAHNKNPTTDPTVE